MTKDELLVEVRAGRASEMACDFILDGIPQIFETDPPQYDIFKAAAARLLDTDSDAVRVVGSARSGYSLSPDTYGIPFSDASDIDIVVVDTAAFDSLWWAMSSWSFPFPLHHWPADQRNWCFPRVNSCFNGWFQPVELSRLLRGAWVTPPPLREIRVKWFEAMKQLGRGPLVSGHDCQARLYRTWDCAYRYHSWSLKQIVLMQD